MNMAPDTPLIASEEVRRNFIRSFILVAVMVALVFALSAWIGNELGDVNAGLVIGLIVTLVVLPIQMLTAKWTIIGMSGGKKADPGNLRERRALHIVEGLAVSAGLKRTPDLYIIPTKVPNAFASGWNEDSAFIGVTEGLLDLMDDQELEGVIAHEVGHIIHRDILLNVLVIGLISVLLILAFILERVMLANSFGSNRRRDRDNGGGLIIMLIVLAILIRPIASLIGSLLQLAISRQREYAADAVAVRLCSYNEGLARALSKLSGDKPYSADEVKSLGGKELACMYINFPGGELFSTHPPIAERIRRLRNMY